jgi:RNA polymerase sigma-70 factor (ECF subfamily)
MTLSDAPSDVELLRSMQAGDEDAFVALYRRRQGGIHRFALQMCGSAEIAEDVTQEVFMALMQDTGNFDASRGSLAAYLYGIARNQVLRHLSRDRAYVQMSDETDETRTTSLHDELVSPCDILADLTRGETIERVRQAVLALPAHYREVVALCELHEMSYVEAAAVLDCAVGTVRSRLHRARAMLIEKLRATVDVKPAAGQLRTARCFA